MQAAIWRRTVACWTVLALGATTSAEVGRYSQLSNPQKQTKLTAETAASLYERAIESGSPIARQHFLQESLSVDPDYAPTRAELGQINREGQWVSISFDQNQRKQDTRLREYRQRAEELDGSLKEHRKLARWCDGQGLTEEARPHWLRILVSSPEDQEALSALDSVWSAEGLVENGVQQDLEERVEAFANSAEQWAKRFKRYERLRKTDQAELDAIAAEINSGVIEPIERFLTEKPSQNSKRIVARRRELIDLFFECADALPEYEVTASLTRMAVSAATETDRNSAIDAIRNRSLEATMPLLLTMLSSRIESEIQIEQQNAWQFSYTHEFTQEGQEQDHKHRRSTVAEVTPTSSPRAASRGGLAGATEAMYRAELQARLERLRLQRDLRKQAFDTEVELAQRNEEIAQTNQRVLKVLQTVTEQDRGDHARDWWDYWTRETGYDPYAPRPTRRTYEDRYVEYEVEVAPQLVPRRCECFVAGTPVWTRYGRQPIETLEPGDLVLARDPHSGGLTYRVVADTTTRQPSPMVAVRVGSETIQATVGHPFWVLDRGWRMAKELESGDVVSTVSGPTEVESIESIADAPAHNLVVEGAANYYVGELGVLVHDNTRRRPPARLLVRR